MFQQRRCQPVDHQAAADHEQLANGGEYAEQVLNVRTAGLTQVLLAASSETLPHIVLVYFFVISWQGLKKKVKLDLLMSGRHTLRHGGHNHVRRWTAQCRGLW